MNSDELKELRKKQVLSLNAFIIVFAVTAGAVIILFEVSRLVVLGGLIVYMAISGLYTRLEMDGKDVRLFSWSRKLVNYEKEKLGKEWQKLKQSELTSKIFIVILIAFQLFLGNRHEPFMPANVSLIYWLSLLAGILVLINVSLFFRNRKIDRLTTEELKGFTMREYGLGLVLGFIMLVLVFTVTILMMLGRS